MTRPDGGASFEDDTSTPGPAYSWVTQEVIEAWPAAVVAVTVACRRDIDEPLAELFTNTSRSFSFGVKLHAAFAE
jgi:hypothetical protein